MKVILGLFGLVAAVSVTASAGDLNPGRMPASECIGLNRALSATEHAFARQSLVCATYREQANRQAVFKHCPIIMVPVTDPHGYSANWEEIDWEKVRRGLHLACENSRFEHEIIRIRTLLDIIPLVNVKSIFVSGSGD